MFYCTGWQKHLHVVVPSAGGGGTARGPILVMVSQPQPLPTVCLKVCMLSKMTRMPGMRCALFCWMQMDGTRDSFPALIDFGDTERIHIHKELMTAFGLFAVKPDSLFPCSLRI